MCKEEISLMGTDMEANRSTQAIKSRTRNSYRRTTVKVSPWSTFTKTSSDLSSCSS
ncbi:unnamed protein product [Brassica rapa subsp. narinosa]